MRTYAIARPDDLLQATERRYRQRILWAGEQYSALSTSRIDQSFKDAVINATLTAPDRPSTRAWLHTISQLAHANFTNQYVPDSAVLGHLAADGPTVGRLFELLGWQALGAAFDRHCNVSFELPAAPPCSLSMGEFGSFVVGERWPTGGSWSLSITNGICRLTGPDFFSCSLNHEPEWVSNVSVFGTGIDAFVPLSNASLANRDFQEFPMVRSRRYAKAWAPLVVRAAEAVAGYSQFAASCMRAFVKSVVPLVGGDQGIGSASREEALGLIFLPASEALDEVAECLLHETMHQYLFRIEECGDLFTAETDRHSGYYSPWRTDPRPLRMTLHGAFVFAAVADLYLWSDAPAIFNIDRRECFRRAYYRGRQVRTALDTVFRHAHATRFGRIIMEALEEDVGSILRRSEPSQEDLSSVDEILMAHSEQYVSYTH